MKLLKIMLITLILGGLAVPVSGCGSESEEAELLESQVVTVQRGDLTIDIPAAGNLVLSLKEDLAFDIFYPEATVEEVLVEESESVEEGQVLARLDTSEWDDNLEVLEDKLTDAERQLTVKKRVLATEERDLLQAQINLQTAEYNLDVMAKVQKINDAIEEEEFKVKLAKARLEAGFNLASEEAEHMYWVKVIADAQARITELEKDLRELLADPDSSGVTITKEALKKLAVDLAQEKLEAAQIDVEDARIAIEDAQKDVKDAQEDLDEAKSYSPEVIAPFDGFITKVNVEGGDEVMTGTVAVQLADPNKFEADIMVSEMDIFQVKLGGEASVQVDAMQGLSLPAKVTHIAPTATIQQGVVNYKVKVEIQSLESVMQEWQEARQEEMPEISSGELPERLRQAIEEGRITQEQAEEMMKQRQQGQEAQQAPPGMIPEDFQLREGLTVTVTILVEERNDVLLVPNGAITTQEGQTYVQVISPDGTLEERSIQTGISNWQFTEVTDGLSEGEKVVIPQKTTSASTTPQGQPPFLPGGPPH